MHLGKILLTAIVVTLLSGCASENSKILIIGDSISIGYTPFLKENLVDLANVSHNPGNAQHTGTGLKKIEEWIGEEKWNIIQFNWGLWDLCYRHPDSKVQGNRDKENGKITYEVEDYAANLDSIVTFLKSRTTARLVFVTTSYVPENEAGRYKNDAVKYNEAAMRIMKKHSVIVNDIYEESVSIHKEFGKGSDDVHFSKEGYKELSRPITEFLMTEIAALKST